MQHQINWAQVLRALRTVAERHNNDIIANAASALSVRLEGMGTVWGMSVCDITPLDRQLIEYAVGYNSSLLSTVQLVR